MLSCLPMDLQTILAAAERLREATKALHDEEHAELAIKITTALEHCDEAAFATAFRHRDERGPRGAPLHMTGKEGKLLSEEDSRLGWVSHAESLGERDLHHDTTDADDWDSSHDFLPEANRKTVPG